MEKRTYKRRPGACESCKSRKMKCDGGKPACEKCQESDPLGTDFSILTFHSQPEFFATIFRERDVEGLVCSLEHVLRFRLMNQGNHQSPAVSNYSPNEPDTESSLQAGLDVDNTYFNALWPSPLTLDGEDSGTLDVGSQSYGDQGDALQALLSSECSSHTFDILATPMPLLPSIDQIVNAASPPARDGGERLQKSISELFQNVPETIDYTGCSVLSRIVEGSSNAKFISQRMETALLDTIPKHALSRHNAPDIRSSNIELHEDGLESFRSYLIMFDRRPYMGVRFISRRENMSLFSAMAGDASLSGASVAQLYGAAAIGAQHEWCRNSAVGHGGTLLPLKYFDHALVSLGNPMKQKFTVTFFKAALVLLTYAIQWDSEKVPMLLADCLGCVQALKLHTKRNIRTLACGQEEKTELQKGFWLLYIIEKRYRMRRGQFSAIADDCVDFPPPGLDDATKSEEQQFLTHCLYARLCSYTTHRIYGQEARLLPAHELGHRFHEALLLLEEWKETSLEQSNLERSELAMYQLSIHLCHYELLLCICAEQTFQPTTTPCCKKAYERIMKASEEVLRLLSKLNYIGVAVEWGIIETTILAFCGAACSLSTASDRTTLLRYMGSAIGVFARGSMVLDLPFERLSAVVAEAFKLEHTDPPSSANAVF